MVLPDLDGDRAGRPQGAEGDRTGAFPPEIPRRLIRMFSVVGDTVLDPFAGTGTTLWEAARLGRNAVGVEIDPVLCERLRARIGPDPGSVRRGSSSRLDLLAH